MVETDRITRRWEIDFLNCQRKLMKKLNERTNGLHGEVKILNPKESLIPRVQFVNSGKKSRQQIEKIRNEDGGVSNFDDCLNLTLQAGRLPRQAGRVLS